MEGKTHFFGGNKMKVNNEPSKEPIHHHKPIDTHEIQGLSKRVSSATNPTLHRSVIFAKPLDPSRFSIGHGKGFGDIIKKVNQ